ncbi:MAG: hypothetical protein ACTJLL_02710 [Anaplasma sp.]
MAKLPGNLTGCCIAAPIYRTETPQQGAASQVRARGQQHHTTAAVLFSVERHTSSLPKESRNSIRYSKSVKECGDKQLYYSGYALFLWSNIHLLFPRHPETP